MTAGRTLRWALALVLAALAFIAAGSAIVATTARAADPPPIVVDDLEVLAQRADAGQAATLLILGDSTGDGRNEWAYRLTQSFAARWPGHAVWYTTWTGTAYAAWTTMQAGPAGAPIIRVWNGSASGKSSRYHQDRIATMVTPTAPNLTLISHGHNQDVDDTGPISCTGATGWRGQYLDLTQAVKAAVPTTAIGVILQNPRTDNLTVQADRGTAYRQLAADQGYGVIDVHAVYLGNPNWATQWMEDHAHPNAAGQWAWSRTVASALGAS